MLVRFRSHVEHDPENKSILKGANDFLLPPHRDWSTS